MYVHKKRGACPRPHAAAPAVIPTGPVSLAVILRRSRMYHPVCTRRALRRPPRFPLTPRTLARGELGGIAPPIVSLLASCVQSRLAAHDAIHFRYRICPSFG